MLTCDVAIIGAGPYGLGVAAHLRAAGVGYRIFGEVMGFWKHQMPIGMLLRSERDGSHFSDPMGAYRLAAYERVIGAELPERTPLDDYVRYGEWFQQQAVPDVDARMVRHVAPADTGFTVTLDDSDVVSARRVVVATGLAAFANRPGPLAGLSCELVSHSCEERDLGRFRGQRVAVVGAGQSALESAALLSEGGARVEVVCRHPEVYWLAQTGHISRESGRLAHILYPPGAVGPLGINWIVQLPGVYRALPVGLQTKVSRRALRPAGSGWLRPRVGNVVFTTGREITRATPDAAGLRLTLSDGGERHVDHVLIATGYRVDVGRYPFLAPELARRVAQRDGHPILGRGFESSVPGLHFVGAASAVSYGPLMRFVAGTGYTAKAIARAIGGQAPARSAEFAQAEATG
jgi:thioredoxin reductase